MSGGKRELVTLAVSIIVGCSDGPPPTARTNAEPEPVLCARGDLCAALGAGADGTLPGDATPVTAVWRGVIGHTANRGYHGPEWVMCIPNAAGLERQLGFSSDDVVDRTECSLEPEPGARSQVDSMLVHLPTGRRALSVGISGLELERDRGSFHVHTFHGPLWGDGHECVLTRTDEEWRVTGCIMLYIS